MGRPRYFVRREHDDSYLWYWSGNPETPEPSLSDPSVVWVGSVENPSVREAINQERLFNERAAAKREESS